MSVATPKKSSLILRKAFGTQEQFTQHLHAANEVRASRANTPDKSSDSDMH
jgi:hypothetical protein